MLFAVVWRGTYIYVYIMMNAYVTSISYMQMYGFLFCFLNF